MESGGDPSPDSFHEDGWVNILWDVSPSSGYLCSLRLKKSASECTYRGSSFERHKRRILIAFCSFSSSFEDETIKCLSSTPIPKGRDELKTFKYDESVLKRFRRTKHYFCIRVFLHSITNVVLWKNVLTNRQMNQTSKCTIKHTLTIKTKLTLSYKSLQWN